MNRKQGTGVRVVLQILHTDLGWLKAPFLQDAAFNLLIHMSSTRLCCARNRRVWAGWWPGSFLGKAPTPFVSTEVLTLTPNYQGSKQTRHVAFWKSELCVFRAYVWEVMGSRKPTQQGQLEVKYSLVEFYFLNQWKCKCDADKNWEIVTDIV